MRHGAPTIRLPAGSPAAQPEQSSREPSLNVSVLRHARTPAEVEACFPVMQQLRPHLQTPADLLARVRRMAGEHYQILCVWQHDAVIAAAGYRLQENLIYGRFLYVDDLVTRDDRLVQGHVARLVDELSHNAGQESCAKLVLDTGLSNALAQRFYFRQGLLSGAMRFSGPINKEPI